VRGEAGLFLVEVDGYQVETHWRAALQGQQHVEQRVGILAARQADHHAVAVRDHPEILDRLADQAAQASLQAFEGAGSGADGEYGGHGG